MKINILYDFQEGPWGGGNQFLKALKSEFQVQGIYEENPQQAEVVLFNSHHQLKDVLKLKKKCPDKIFIHRIDGPLSAYRASEEYLDRLLFKINGLLADGTIFQSSWSKKQNKKFFPLATTYETVIHNASDDRFFNQKDKNPFRSSTRKVKLVASSWSLNALKGFDIYQYLDEHLDFSRYEMLFFGRSPVPFRNIALVPPLPQAQVAKALKQNDIFVFASRIESCSNALIEAISCGLPAVAFNGSSNPEIVRKGGELFEGKGDVISQIEKVASNYKFYQKRLPYFSLSAVAERYFCFARQIFEDAQSGYYFPRQVGLSANLIFAKDCFFANCRKLLNKLQ